MKTGKPALYPNDAVAEAVTDYSEGHSLALPRHLLDYHAEISRTAPSSNYMISTFQAQALVFLARLIDAKRVLEIGVYMGFSSLVWSHAVGPSGAVTGLEFSPEYAAAARAAFAAHGAANVRVIEGDGLTTLPALDVGADGPFDVVFVDAQKSGYPAYLTTILERSQLGSASRLLRPGGLIIGDNALRRGLVALEGAANPLAGFHSAREEEAKRRGEADDAELARRRVEDIESVRKFNDMVRDSPRLEPLMLPLWDGLNLARIVD